MRSTSFVVGAAPWRGLLLLALACSAGCSASQARVDQFGAFAAAGGAYTKAIEPVLSESFDATATTSSLVLLQARDMLPQAGDRLTALEQADDDLKARIALLKDLKTHLGVLQSYFDALASLAGTTAESSGMTGVAQGLVAQLGSLSKSIASASIAGTAVSSLVAPAAGFAFVAYESKVLNDELRRNAPAIDAEIRTQEAALKMLAEAYASDLEVVVARDYRDSVELPFSNAASIPDSWTATRSTMLLAGLNTTSVEAAADAATKLRSSFVALVENRLTGADIAALQSELASIVSAIQAGKNTGDTEEVRQP